MKKLLCAATLAVLAALPAHAAELEFSVYSGLQEAQDSRVSGVDETGAPFSASIDWGGKSFAAPPYYGVRIMRRGNSGWAFGLEVTHDKVYPDDAGLAATGFDHLEFTDGLNIITLNADRAFGIAPAWTAYAGAGLGVAVPHVETITPAGVRTWEYQLTGPAARWYLGLRRQLTESLSAFGEYQGTYSSNDADLVGGGRLETDIVTHALNIGLTYSF